jgi:hypothetical protein
MTEIEVQPEDSILDVENVRGDHDLYCPRKEQTVLVLDGTCFSRARDHGCCDCVCDRNFILTRLILFMLDILEGF